MFESAARKPARLEQPSKATVGSKARLNRKIWLPKLYYDALPWFYLFAGVAALLATLYINAWFWILPHSLLFSAACIHFSVYVFHRRRRGARDSAERRPDPPST